MQDKFFSILSFVIIVLSVFILFAIKDRVSALNYQLSEALKQINYERDMIHTLKAEKSYLSSPDRLRRLSANYLKLESVKVSQMTKDPLFMQEKKDELQDIFAVAPIKHEQVRWRYKKSAGGYLQTVSHKGK